MSFTLKSLMALGLLTLAACGQQEEEVVFVEPAPVMEEPAMSKF